MAARPWETQDQNTDTKSIRSLSLGGEVTKSYARHVINSNKPSPPSDQKPTRPSTPKSSSQSSKVRRKLKPSSPMGQDEDMNSVYSLASERNRRHSIAGSSVRDDESLASSGSVPSYMTPTQSARARTRGESPLGVDSGSSAKKRLSFPSSPARPRRHSGPPKVDVSVVSEQSQKSGAA